MNSLYSPILLFVYNRPEHARMAVQSLQQNSLAKESELFIYSDAAKNEETQPAVDEVRRFIHTVSGFAKITIIEREKNWGLFIFSIFRRVASVGIARSTHSTDHSFYTYFLTI